MFLLLLVVLCSCVLRAAALGQSWSEMVALAALRDASAPAFWRRLHSSLCSSCTCAEHRDTWARNTPRGHNFLSSPRIASVRTTTPPPPPAPKNSTPNPQDGRALSEPSLCKAVVDDCANPEPNGPQLIAKQENQRSLHRSRSYSSLVRVYLMQWMGFAWLPGLLCVARLLQKPLTKTQAVVARNIGKQNLGCGPKTDPLRGDWGGGALLV